MSDKRIIDPKTNQPINFTCENSKFKTDITQGFAHGAGHALGSVYDSALLASNGWSLWLEYVVEKNNGEKWMWLMWYESGKPTIPMSGVFKREDLKTIVARLAERV